MLTKDNITHFYDCHQNLKNLDTWNYIKIWTIWFYKRAMCPKDADGMANSAMCPKDADGMANSAMCPKDADGMANSAMCPKDADGMARPWVWSESTLICPDMSVQIFRIITKISNKKLYIPLYVYIYTIFIQKNTPGVLQFKSPKVKIWAKTRIFSWLKANFSGILPPFPPKKKWRRCLLERGHLLE